jgi:hypothetical protein
MNVKENGKFIIQYDPLTKLKASAERSEVTVSAGSNATIAVA